MARFVISSSVNRVDTVVFSLTNDGDQLFVSPGATTSSSGEGIFGALRLAGSNQALFLGGSSFGHYGVEVPAAGETATIVVEPTGLAAGSIGVRMEGAGLHTIVNLGTISGTAWAVDSEASAIIRNFGTISGGVRISGLNDATGFVTNKGVIIGGCVFGSGDDTYNGADGSVTEVVSGFGGDDTLIGGAGRDQFFDGDGRDSIEAGAGNDFVGLALDGESDEVDGGDGLDTLRFDTAASRVMVDLTAGTAVGVSIGSDIVLSFENVRAGLGNDRIRGSDAPNVLDGGIGNDELLGLGGEDRLIGGLGNATMDGGDGNDRLIGSAGRDVMQGGTGNDYVYGGFDIDTMTGGSGADRFVFRDIEELFVISAGTNDRITDFKKGQDIVDLSVMDHVAGFPDDTLVFVGAGPITAAGQVAVRQAGGNTFIDIAFFTSGVAGTIRLDGLINLTASDFVL